MALNNQSSVAAKYKLYSESTPKEFKVSYMPKEFKIPPNVDSHQACKLKLFSEQSSIHCQTRRKM